MMEARVTLGPAMDVAPELTWTMRSVFIGDAERFRDYVAIRFWRVI